LVINKKVSEKLRDMIDLELSGLGRTHQISDPVDISPEN
jgi:hypothetical protein